MKNTTQEIFWIGQISVSFSHSGVVVEGKDKKKCEAAARYLIHEGFVQADSRILIGIVN